MLERRWIRRQGSHERRLCAAVFVHRLVRMTTDVSADRRFVEAVRARLNDSMDKAGFCVDLWITWTSTDDSLEVRLEHWTIQQLADRYAGELSVDAIHPSLPGPGDIEPRLETIAQVLGNSMAAAAG